ncbi:putative mitochondrial protein AtMg00310 [Silene latifolia]|uniref:putative mitochondrial protein AtMg00310 n=1 Tax=Silene latifolia TaxID=37657 RepID=UPI003D789296
MSVFKIPTNFCDELRSMMSRFWWNHEERKRGISWVAWKKLCQPKGMGGMGFRDFKLFNLALLGKQAWRLTTAIGSLWEQVMRARYYPNGVFMTANLGYNPSYIWRRLVEARMVLDRGMRSRIGHDRSTRVWRDAWLPGTHTGRVISPCFNGNEDMLVSELMTESTSWDVERLSSLFLPFEKDRIANIRLSQHRPSDIWYWRMEKDEVYSVKSAYKLLAGRDGVEMSGASDWSREMWLWKRLWQVPVWP